MHIPRATYRLQFNPRFSFKAAKDLVAYLSELGISTIYASPIFKARPGSTHGYDITDPNLLNPELGTREELAALIKEARSHGLGWLQDFVPNHMAYHSSNQMLMDIFEKGPSSPFFGFFDIVWDHIRENLRGKVIAPFLGSPYGETLEKGELVLQYGEGVLSIKYYETVYPLSIKSYATFVGHRLDHLRDELGGESDDFMKMLGIETVLKNLPAEHVDDLARNAQMLLAKDALWYLYQRSPDLRAFIDGNVEEFNRDADLLHELLSEQWFQLTFWRVASKEINYQRFFNINDLISLRMEDDETFQYVHKLALGMLREGNFTGIRIDHVDGLYDPTAYLLSLRERAADAYIVVEKILELTEQLPAKWPVQGTTGYEFMNYVNELFVDGRNEESFQRIYEQFVGDALDYDGLLYEKKRLIIERHLTGDLDNLTYLLKTISTTTRDAIDLPWEGLMDAIIETSAWFPVYRTYVAGEEVEDRDRAFIKQAIEKAKARAPELTRAIDFLRTVLLKEYPDYLDEDQQGLWLTFEMRFQQFTSPLMAKGLEDTTFYLFNRLVSLNEVGGNPGRFGISLHEFHDFNRRRAIDWPHTINATATHDTKRGEDTRARINVLSEMPDMWESHLRQWSERNARYKQTVNGEPVPDHNNEYFLYQTLTGALPFEGTGSPEFIERIKSYMLKAAREAKTHTFWLDNNAEYEEALLAFTEAVLKDDVFMDSLKSFQKRVAHYGLFNSLSQALLKVTSPGLPDFYQGSELWDLSLVDPDNRRPVDYKKRARIMEGLKGREKSKLSSLIKELLSSPEDGRIKLFTIMRALAARTSYSEVFESGEYIPLFARGERANHVIAFARRGGRRWAVTIAPRLLASIIGEGELPLGGPVWLDTRIEMPLDAPAAWEDKISGEVIESGAEVRLGDALSIFPAALLAGESRE
jgi:(1->4)-alpha-D-glucan 1-alpha-D-glucosylmutase